MKDNYFQDLVLSNSFSNDEQNYFDEKTMGPHPPSVRMLCIVSPSEQHCRRWYLDTRGSIYTSQMPRCRSDLARVSRPAKEEAVALCDEARFCARPVVRLRAVRRVVRGSDL